MALPNKHDAICATFEAQRDIQADPSPGITREYYLLYISEVSKRTGIPINYDDNPAKYVFFVYAKQLAKKFGLSARQFITAQFESLDWANGIPTPSQLVTRNSEERTVKWMAENRIKKHENTEHINAKAFWAKVKDHAHRTGEQQV